MLHANKNYLTPSERRRRGFLLVVGTVLLGTSVGVLAIPKDSHALADGGATASSPVAALKPTLTGFDPTIAGVWGVLFLFTIAAVVVVMISKKGRGASDGNGSVHLVDTLQLGGRRMVHLVRVDDRKYLIGNSERGIHFLSNVPQNEIEAEVEELATNYEGEAPFASYLNLGGRG